LYDLKRNIIAERRKDNINDREASKHIKEIEQISNNFYNKINNAQNIEEAKEIASSSEILDDIDKIFASLSGSVISRNESLSKNLNTLKESLEIAKGTPSKETYSK